MEVAVRVAFLFLVLMIIGTGFVYIHPVLALSRKLNRLSLFPNK
jgi:hypothetical protein